MRQTTLTLVPTEGADGPATAESLRRDLEEHVGSARFADAELAEGSKSGSAVQFGALLISLLGTPAVVALVSVLKSYFDRRQMTEVEITGPGGSVKLKLPPGSRLSSEEITAAIKRVLGAD